MRKIRGKLGLAVCIAFLVVSCSRSTVMLRGSEAEAYISKNDHLIAPGYYAFGEVRNRQSNVLMLAVFNRDHGEKNDGNFLFLRREKSMGYRSSSNPYNSILLNSPNGKRGSDPTSENLAEILKNNLSPIIILDSKGIEQAVVYRPAGERVTAFQQDDHSLRLEIGERTVAQGDIAYYIGLDNVIKSPDDAPRRGKIMKEKETMSEIKIGDLVKWESGSKTRVGVVKEISQDGTAVINIPTTEGSRQEKIRISRLTVITSTVESDK